MLASSRAARRIVMRRTTVRSRAPHNKKTAHAKNVAQVSVQDRDATKTEQTEAVTPGIETLNVLTRTDTGFQYWEMDLANPTNKLNDAAVPVQTPIPRNDVIIDSMTGSTADTAIDLRDEFYQILMRENETPLTAVTTPSGMLWEWLVIPQGA
ncbi:hypothetical protein ON010_g17555 [Phytophthora cinnamomi]|nr:hypothetical protein ON010_g17555 [Phytophthora cinnamomi]